MTRNPADGRQVVVELAAAGRLAYEACAPVMQRRRDALQAEFSPEEIETFVSLLDRLEAFLRRPFDTLLENKVEE